jgi:hypothetical protein
MAQKENRTRKYSHMKKDFLYWATVGQEKCEPPSGKNIVTIINSKTKTNVKNKLT